MPGWGRQHIEIGRARLNTCVISTHRPGVRFLRHNFHTTSSAGSRPRVPSGRDGRGVQSHSLSRLPHRTPAFSTASLGRVNCRWIGARALSTGFFQFLRIHEGPLPARVRCRRHDGCGANAAVGARITNGCRRLGKSRTRSVGRKSATACGPITAAERRYVGQLMYRRGFFQSNNFLEVSHDLVGVQSDSDPRLASAFGYFIASVSHGSETSHGGFICFTQNLKRTSSVLARLP